MTASVVERQAAIAAGLERQAGRGATLARERPGANMWEVDRQFAALTATALGEPAWVADGYELTVTDLFCGAGGSSSGLESVPGIRVAMAANHWRLAIETHQRNFPHVDHDTQDIAAVDPGRFPWTDILWASPACTFFSQGRGEKQNFTREATEPTLFDLDDRGDEDDEPIPDEAKERSRALMKDIPRFAAHHRYRAVIVENVVPLLKWVYLPKLIARMRALGYKHKVLTLNSAFAHQLGAPAPQLRDRVYLVFWLEKYRDPDFDRWTRPRAWCERCGEVVTALYAPKNAKRPYGMYNREYTYRCPRVSCRNGVVAPFTLPAMAAIDLSQPGTRIGDRKPPLAAKTRGRVDAWMQTRPQAITLEVGGNTYERRPGVRAWPVVEPLRTLHTTESRALAVPPGGAPGKTYASPKVDVDGMAVIPLRNNNVVKSPMEPLDTVAAGGNHHALASLPAGETAEGGSTAAAPADEVPVRILSAAGTRGLLRWNPEYLYAYDTGRVRSTRMPLPTQTTVDGDALIEYRPSLDDCLFRMLTAEEIKLGMAFPAGFVLLGQSKKLKVRMCGNAVTPPVARDVVAAVAEAVAGYEVAV